MEEPGLNRGNATDPGESITINNSYEEIIKTQNKKAITYVGKQEQILKRFEIRKILLKR